MSRSTLNILAIGLIAAAVYLHYGGGGGGGTDTLPAVPEPSPAVKSLVAPITAKLTDKEDAATLAWFYFDFADIVERDAGKQITTTPVLRDFNRNSVTLGLSGAIAPVSGLADAIDDAIVRGMGYTPGDIPASPIDTATRAKLVESLRGVSWACCEAAR